MGSKNNPGEFDCWAAADPDEELFVLLGRDPDAAVAVRAWADAREKRIRSGECPESDWQKVATARQTAWSMDAYRIKRAMDTRQGTLTVHEVRPIGDAAPGLVMGYSSGVSDRFVSPPHENAYETTARREVQAARKTAQVTCLAIRQGDELWCRRCSLRWGVEDKEPPECPDGASR